MKRNIPPALAVLALACFVQACGFSNPKDPGAGSTNPSSTTTSTDPADPNRTTVTATFSQVSSQILQPKCVSCHNSGGQSPDLSSYAAFATSTRYVMPGNPGQSAIYTETASGSMPRSGAPLTDSQLQLLSSWITDGAQNN